MYKDKREVKHKLRVLQHAENVGSDVEAEDPHSKCALLAFDELVDKNLRYNLLD
jgi:hypothetical protein